MLKALWNALRTFLFGPDPPPVWPDGVHVETLKTLEVEGHTLTFSLITNDGPESPESILSKQATSLKDAGDIDGAIAKLRELNSRMSTEPDAAGVESFLRLPLYLQKAGRGDEAWHEFNRLITHTYPDNGRDQLTLMMHSRIYDKVRLFLQREKKPDLAVRFGVYSAVCWAIGLHRQKRRSELKGYFDRDSIAFFLGPLLKKAKKLDRMAELTDIIAADAKQMPNIDLPELGRKIDQVMMKR